MGGVRGDAGASGAGLRRTDPQHERGLTLPERRHGHIPPHLLGLLPVRAEPPDRHRHPRDVHRTRRRRGRGQHRAFVRQSGRDHGISPAAAGRGVACVPDVHCRNNVFDGVRRRRTLGVAMVASFAGPVGRSHRVPLETRHAGRSGAGSARSGAARHDPTGTFQHRPDLRDRTGARRQDRGPAVPAARTPRLGRRGASRRPGDRRRPDDRTKRSGGSPTRSRSGLDRSSTRWHRSFPT